MLAFILSGSSSSATGGQVSKDVAICAPFEVVLVIYLHLTSIVGDSWWSFSALPQLKLEFVAGDPGPMCSLHEGARNELPVLSDDGVKCGYVNVVWGEGNVSVK